MFIYTSSSLTSPDSAENFSFNAVQAVCSNLESSNCEYTKTGEYFIDQNIRDSRCVGGYSKVNSCDSRDMVLADSFSTGRMGSNIYKFNGAVIGSNFLTGIQKLMAIKSLISALFLLITALVLPKKLQRAFIFTLLFALTIPENIMQVGSIAPIGHSKIFYFMTLVLVYSVLEAELKKVRELLSWILTIFYSVYLGLQRTDQVVSFAFMVGGLSIIQLLRIKFQTLLLP